MAQADSELAFGERVDELQQSTVWKENTKFRGWFGGTWLKEYKVGTSINPLTPGRDEP